MDEDEAYESIICVVVPREGVTEEKEGDPEKNIDEMTGKPFTKGESSHIERLSVFIYDGKESIGGEVKGVGQKGVSSTLKSSSSSSSFSSFSLRSTSGGGGIMALGGSLTS